MAIREFSCGGGKIEEDESSGDGKEKERFVLFVLNTEETQGEKIRDGEHCRV